MKKLVISAVALSLAGFAGADVLDRPGGIRVGQCLTIRPYVSVSYTYDSNVDSAREQRGSSCWSVSPGFMFDYNRGNWSATGSAYYNYHYNTRYSNQLSNGSFGQNLALRWGGVETSGWTFSLTESYQQVSQDDDMTTTDGRGLGRDRKQFTFAATAGKRFNNDFHISIYGSTYYLDYENDIEEYAPLYGWSRYTVGGSLGYTLTPLSDLFLTASYSGYWQDNECYLGGEGGYDTHRIADENSKSWTVHAGIGTYMTEKIQYRVSAGWTHMEYGSIDNTDGFTYSVMMNWRMNSTWNMSLMANSYYHPSERETSSNCRSDNLSWGVSHAMIRGKLTANFNISYRHENNNSARFTASEYNTDTLTARLGANYTFNRFFGIYSSVEYQTEINGGNEYVGNHYDYNRWRLTVGVRFTY